MNYAGTNPRSNLRSDVVAIIPARLGSTRLPEKVLLEIAGRPMICWVVERALAARSVSHVIVATDDPRIVDVVESAGHRAIMTRADHLSGTDRIAEIAGRLDEAEIIVNIQADEPLISPETIDRAVKALGRSDKNKNRDYDKEEYQGNSDENFNGERVGIVTIWEPIESAADVLSPHIVKLISGPNDDVIYFSRLPVPYPREAVRRHGSLEAALQRESSLLKQFRKHTGLYVYRRDVLLKFAKWPQSTLERSESLEQLRAIEHGARIKAIEASTPSIGVDTISDLERVRAIVSGEVALRNLST